MRGATGRPGWTLRRVVRRAVEIARRDGMRALWFAALGATVYRRLIVLERAYDDDVPTVAPRVAVTFQPLAATEVDEYVRFRGEADPQAVRRRLEAGHWCMVARHEGAIVHAGDWP